MCYFSITSIQWHRTDEFKQKATNCCVRFGHSLRSAVRCQRQLVNDSNSLPRGRTTEWTEDAGNEVRCSTRDKLVFRASEKSLGNGNLISGVSRQSHCRRGEGRRGFLFSISKRSGEKGNNRCLNKISKRPRYQTDSLSDCFSLSLSLPLDIVGYVGVKREIELKQCLTPVPSFCVSDGIGAAEASRGHACLAQTWNKG